MVRYLVLNPVIPQPFFKSYTYSIISYPMVRYLRTYKPNLFCSRSYQERVRAPLLSPFHSLGSWLQSSSSRLIAAVPPFSAKIKRYHSSCLVK